MLFNLVTAHYNEFYNYIKEIILILYCTINILEIQVFYVVYNKIIL